MYIDILDLFQKNILDWNHAVNISDQTIVYIQILVLYLAHVTKTNDTHGRSDVNGYP